MQTTGITDWSSLYCCFQISIAMYIKMDQIVYAWLVLTFYKYTKNKLFESVLTVTVVPWCTNQSDHCRCITQTIDACFLAVVRWTEHVGQFFVQVHSFIPVASIFRTWSPLLITHILYVTCCIQTPIASPWDTDHVWSWLCYSRYPILVIFVQFAGLNKESSDFVMNLCILSIQTVPTYCTASLPCSPTQTLRGPSLDIFGVYVCSHVLHISVATSFTLLSPCPAVWYQCLCKFRMVCLHHWYLLQVHWHPAQT